MISTVAAVLHNRRTVIELARRDFRARYAGSVLGLTWSVLEPMVQFGLYFVVFSSFLGMRFVTPSGVNMTGFYLVGGLIPYLALQEMLVRAAGLVRGSAQLIRHVVIPVEVLLAGALLAVLVRYTIAFGLALGVAVVMGALAWTQLPWLLVAVVLLVVGAWGLSLLLVPLGAFLPDVVPVVGTAMMALCFLTPVVYPETQLPASVARWLVVNPLVGLLDAFRTTLTGQSVSLVRVAVTLAAVIVFALVGSLVFSRRAAALRDLA